MKPHPNPNSAPSPAAPDFSRRATEIGQAVNRVLVAETRDATDVLVTIDVLLIALVAAWVSVDGTITKLVPGDERAAMLEFSRIAALKGLEKVRQVVASPTPVAVATALGVRFQVSPPLPESAQ